MTDDSQAAARWFALVMVRIAGSAGAVFGLVLLGRAHALVPQLLGGAILISALLMIATVPRSLARKWRTPPKNTLR